MAHDIKAPLLSVTVNGLPRLCTTWKITRKDGVILRFTNHDGIVTLDGENYTPVSAPSPSAHERVEGLEDKNFEVTGVLTDDSITEEDLRAGRFLDAQVDEVMLDPKIPWAGEYQRQTYTISTTSHDSEIWKGGCTGLLLKMLAKRGDIESRTCPYEVGDSKCTINLGPFTQTGTVSSVSISRRKFISGVTFADNDLQDGKLTWTSGENNGLYHDVRGNVGGTIELHVETEFDIGVGDTFSVSQGCNGTAKMCDFRYGNLENFGGIASPNDSIGFLPGPDKVLTTPKRK